MTCKQCKGTGEVALFSTKVKCLACAAAFSYNICYGYGGTIEDGFIICWDKNPLHCPEVWSYSVFLGAAYDTQGNAWEPEFDDWVLIANEELHYQADALPPGLPDPLVATGVLRPSVIGPAGLWWDLTVVGEDELVHTPTLP